MEEAYLDAIRSYNVRQAGRGQKLRPRLRAQHPAHSSSIRTDSLTGLSQALIAPFPTKLN